MAAAVQTPLNGHAGPIQTHETSKEAAENDAKEVDIVINNVVSSFNVRCHLNLREIALNGKNVEYRKEHGMVTMKLRRPYTTASIWSSGKITCTGANSEDQARIAARRFARALQKLGFNTRFRNYRVVNVLGTVTLPFAINIINFSQAHAGRASYEPELHPGVTYKIKDPKATLKIFSTGSITVTAPSVTNVQRAVEHIYPYVEEHAKTKVAADKTNPVPKSSNSKGKKRPPQPQIQRRAPVAKKPVLEDSDSDEENVSDESLESD